ncbi:glucose-6-phosphate isomerase [Pseudogemmobacter sp. W21_MBD1_M6]|uniref:glucose-6-phosphate isomerase n=1 Tax=Pseudogemmobacter sp. W21_MBD1_M6 TaxID=3240271 RepID=UPI003F99ABF5
MKNLTRPLICAALLSLAACETMTSDQQMVVGGLAGATLGVITADAFDADRNWVLIAGLAGATIGTIVAQNNATQQCAISNGDGTYRVVRCI